MIEIFKTSINEEAMAYYIQWRLLQSQHINRVSFDLEDCDRIMKVEAEKDCSDDIVNLLNQLGFSCNVL